MTSMRLPTATESEQDKALEEATLALRRGDLAVLPTDTVYGIAADAFDRDAVQKLLDAKGRGRQMPPPVLISSPATLDALASGVPEFARTLIAHFWPGALTLVCHEQPSLRWDLGETHGTVAVRLPNNHVTLGLLERTGPLAVSSANLSGQPAALTVDQAEEMLGDKVSVYLDAGEEGGGEASTIVDVTGPTARILRLGAISVDALREALSLHPDVVLEGEGVEPLAEHEAADSEATEPEAATELETATPDSAEPAEQPSDVSHTPDPEATQADEQV